MKIKSLNSSLVVPLLVLSILILIPQSTHAYTPCDGVETNDIIRVDYVGTIQETGEEFDSGDNVQFTVSTTGSQAVIQGFYEGLLGMKIGQQKTIVVPPAKGYTNPGHELNGKTLVFDTYLRSVEKDIRECDEDTGPSTTQQILKVFGWIIGIGVFSFIGISFYLQLQKTTTPACVHCKEQGRSRASEGKCNKCGQAYCRASFSRGCPNCGSNSFIPHK